MLFVTFSTLILNVAGLHVKKYSKNICMVQVMWWPQKYLVRKRCEDEGFNYESDFEIMMAKEVL